MQTSLERRQKILRVIALCVWAALLIYALIHRGDFTLDRILHYTPERPLLAFGVLMLFFALKSLTVFFYSGVIYIASGVLFPAPIAILVNFCGTVVMALIPYLLGRAFDLKSTNELREKHPKIKEFDHMRDANSFAFVVVLRCINIVNLDIGSLYCGAAKIAPVPFLLGTLLGKLTDIIMLSVMGESVETRNSAPFLIALAIDLSIAGIVTLWSKKRNEKKETEAT